MKSTGYRESLNQYQDLVNQPTWSDSMANAFNAAGSAPVAKPGDFEANAALLGMGAGFKGAANERRAAQLQPMLEQAGIITAKAAEIEAQMQQAQSYQLAINEFGQKYTPLVAEFANAVNSNDPRATMMFKDLINKAQMIPGYENLEGDSWNPSGGFGLALNTETGEYRKITADEIVSAVAPAAQAIYGDRWFEKFMPLNAGFAKDAAYAFNMKREEDALGLEGKRADVNLKQAHAGVYQQQANQIQNEMANPPKEKGTIDPQKMSEDLDVISKQIETIGEKGEQKGFSRVMSEITPGHTWQLTPEQTQIDTLGQLLRGQMFKAFGYRNETEFEQIPTISSNNSVKQNQSIIQQYKNLYLKEQNNQKPDDAKSGNINKQDKVLMLDPITGTTDWVHRDWVQDAIDNDGLQVVNE